MNSKGIKVFYQYRCMYSSIQGAQYNRFKYVVAFNFKTVDSDAANLFWSIH